MTFFDDKAATINALVAAVEAIEIELGRLPAGAYSSVRTRLDILEGRINNPFAPAPNTLNPFFIGNTGVTIQTGFGDPSILNVLAIPGSLFLREDGYNNQGLYEFRPDGHWHQIDTDPWTANGDLAGTIYTQTVIGLQNHPINPDATLLQTDSEGDGYVLTWNASGGPSGPPGFAILAGSGITNTGPSTVTGDVGSFPTPTETGFNTLTLIGTNHHGDPVTQAAKVDLAAQYLAFQALTPTATIPTDLNTQVLVPGVYNSLSGTFMNTGTVTLNAGGNANATWVFQMASTLVTAAGSNVVLINGAQAKNVTWAVGSSATLGTTSHLEGNILALTSITLTTGASVHGSVLAQNGAVTLDTNVIVATSAPISTGWWEPQIGFFAAGDLAGNKIHQTVINLQGNKLSVGSPTNAYVLTWNAVLMQWEPQSPAVIFDPKDTPGSTNIRGARLNTQSPIDNTKLGIVNLSSDSTQTTTGVTGNYSAILAGDQNQVSGDSSLVVGGLQNIISGSSSFILGGFNNNIHVLDHDSVIVAGSNHVLNGTGHNFIGGGSNNSISGASFSDFILGGLSNVISNATNAFIGVGISNVVAAGNSSTALNGLANIIGGNYNTVLNGTNNILSPNAFYSVVNGASNSVNDGYCMVQGLENTIAQGTNKYVSVWGDFNTVNVGSHYSSLWGCNLTVSDGYVAVWGDHNILNVGSTYADIHGRLNTVNGPNSQYTSIWGHDNSIGNNSPFTAIFGYTNTIQNNSTNAFVVGQLNNIGGAYNSAWGLGNAVTQNTQGYSSAWGNSNIVVGDWSNIWGYLNNIGSVSSPSNSSNVWGQYNTILGPPSAPANFANVFGYYGNARVTGQFSHSANNINGTAGAEQFSRIILDSTPPATGTTASGGGFTLGIAGTGSPLTLEDGKSYDMTIRILITSEPPTGFVGCANFVYDVLAHAEGGVLFLDNVNLTLGNVNGTGWSTTVTASANILVITIPAQGTFSRRAVATIEWRELSRM
jgi:hypothetical protein